MLQFSDLLSRYEHLLRSKRFGVRSFCQVVEEVLNVSIPTSVVKIKDGTVFVNTHSFIKNEILINKELISSKMEEKTGQKIFNIR